MKYKRGGIKIKKHYNTYSITAPIEVTHHVIQRFKLRQQKQEISDIDAIKKIKNQIRQSKLIAIEGNMEHRSHNGSVYVIKREFCKDSLGLLHEKIVVVTMKMSKMKLKQYYSDDFNMETLDFSEVTRKAL